MKNTKRRPRRGPVAAPTGRPEPADDRPPGPARDRRTWLVVIPLVLLVLAAFSPVVGNGFVNWDDDHNFLENPHFGGVGWPQVRWAWTTFWLGVYQPLGWMLSGAQYALWGLDPRGYHLVSLLLHAGNAAVLYVVAADLLVRCRPDPFLESPWARAVGAGLATALFAVHPLRVEAVAWVSCQSYLPCALSGLLAVLAYLRAVGSGPERRRGWWAASLLLFAAAVLFKAPAVSLPAVLVILDVYPLRRLGGGPGRWFGPSSRGVWLEKAPFFAVALAASVLAIAARSHAGALSTLRGDGPLARIAQACHAAWFYLIKTAMPRDITALYPLPRRIDSMAAPFLVSVLATVGVSITLFLLRRRWPGLLAAWLGYLVILAPASGLLRGGPHLVADRYSYLSTMAMVVPVATGLGLCWAALRRAPAGAGGFAVAGVAAALGLAFLTWHQCLTWRTSEALWTHALAHGAGGSLAHTNLAEDLVNRSRPDEAMAHSLEAVKLDPEDPQAHANLGLLLSQRGEIAAAADQYAEAIRLDPRSVRAHVNLGVIQAQRGDFASAAAHAEAALRVEPDHVEALNNLAMILAACPDPTYRDGRRAVACATRACELTRWSQPGALDTMAAAYAEAGDFAAAAAWQEKAIGLLADERSREDFRSRLALYRAGKPYREPAPR